MNRSVLALVLTLTLALASVAFAAPYDPGFNCPC